MTGSIELFLLLMHRTAGGWQFGMRYTVDIVPSALLLLGYCLRPFFVKSEIAEKADADSGARRIETRFIYGAKGAVIMLGALLILFGLWLNIHGSILMFK